MRYEIRPISDRTPFTGSHEYTPFRATWKDTLGLLGRELDALKATDVIIEVDVTDGLIRQDGMLRADAKVASPCVRIAFGSKVGPLVYATDRYVARYSGDQDWQQNVRAIALGLEALRKVDRYGITKRGEQYQGWAQLPPGTGVVVASSMTRDQARDFLLSLMDDPESARHMLPLEKLVRRARAKSHSDRHGGDRTLWDRVEEAARVLGIS